MKMSDLLGATVKDGVVLIDAIDPSTRIRVHGSTMPLSLKGPEHVMSFSATQDATRQEPRGVVAVWVWNLDGRGEVVSGFIEFDWTKDKPAMLDATWVPSKGRLGQVFYNHLDVVTADNVFTTEKPGPTARRNGENFCYVPDGNLLCRFLIGLASEDDLNAAAVEREIEVAAEIALRAELERNSTLAMEIRRWTDELQTAKEMLRVIKTYGSGGHRALVEGLTEALDGRLPWVSKKQIRKVIAETRPDATLTKQA